MSTVTLNVTVDNISPLISYAPAASWTEGSAANDNLASSYSNGGTFSLCTTQGSSASLTFNGTQVYVFGAKRPNHGPYSVTLDGTSSTFDGFSSPEFFGPLFVSGVLKAGEHTVTVTNELNDTAKPFLDIDFITWTTTAGQNGASSTIEDTSTNFAFTPSSSWSTDLTSNKLTGFSGNNGHVTLTAGATASLTFNGGHVAIFGPIGPTISRYTVQLDGINAGTFNGTKQNYVPQTTLFEANGLGSGQHTLQLISQPAVPGQLLAIDFAQVAANSGGSSVSNSAASSPTGGAAKTASSSKSSIGPAVGGAIGGIAILAGLGLLFFCLMRRRRRQRDEETNANGFGGDKYGAAAAVPLAPHNYTMSTLTSNGATQDPYSVQSSQAQLVGSPYQQQTGQSYQPSAHSYQPSVQSSVPSAPMANPWQPPIVIPTPPVPEGRNFYTVNDNAVMSPSSEAGSSSLGRSSTVQSAGAAGLGAGSYRRKNEHMPLPPTANVPLPVGAPRMQVPGREQDYGPVGPEYGSLPPAYSQATEPYHQPTPASETNYSGDSATSDPYGGYLSEAGSPTRSQYSQGPLQR
ncbi:hypothetical protein C8F01DRAFT_308345 [Mycena amicta]|nr:hypothetical protein C8F01DRAFT_308345 [Mycena amicta]